MKLERQTKAQLIEMVQKLSAELAALRAENSTLRVQAEAPRAETSSNKHYPFVDGRGRAYRIETVGGRAVRCYPN